MRNADVDIRRRKEFAEPPAALARQRDDAHLALVRRGDPGAYVAGISRSRDRQQDIARAPERTYLLGKDLAEVVVVGNRGQERCVGGQGDCRQLRPLALETADQLRREVLRIRGRSAIAACKELAVSEQAIGP